MIIVVLSMNLISVKVFGEMEFWFALIKVAALVSFLLIGIFFVIFGTPTGSPTGFHLISENGGMFPHGVVPALVLLQGVVFAYAAIELVGTTAGETRDARKVIPKAINTVIWRVAIFYVGSVLLLTLLLPYTAYSADESPFVTFFGSIGVDYAAPIMELVVITASLSSLNAGLYSTGRILHSMAMSGSAPKIAKRVSKSGVPYGGILLTSIVAFAGVILNVFVPHQAFEIVLNIASLGILTSWATIALCHMKFVSLAKKGVYNRPEYKMPGAPFTDWIILVFLAGVAILIGFDYPEGTLTVGMLIVIIPSLIFGWYKCRDNIKRISAEREGFTGISPVIADRTQNNWLKERETGYLADQSKNSSDASTDR